MPLTLSLVTPEKTLLTGAVDEVKLPLADGMAGILPGRAPMVARLGYGRLTVRGLKDASNVDGGEQTWFVAGGFVQVSPSKPGDEVSGGTVSVLTNRAMPPSEIDVVAAKAELSEVSSRVPSTPEARTLQSRDQDRLRAMIASAA
ncbi:FoF1 ATP synthase subunit delta/epsilon [Alienimonas chondri]|uniref:ATP synthase epsilon chain n=1 Tax=Alienimonas chondri TaxID=2681879 RepID=A0ABX1VGY2_9PLAN|nr:F0F1 ATP synthase subunit epsilon [Alienimonas chondri]NNJ27399.1 ATP synthase epsilon chain [Alienimonas chondri]